MTAETKPSPIARGTAGTPIAASRGRPNTAPDGQAAADARVLGTSEVISDSAHAAPGGGAASSDMQSTVGTRHSDTPDPPSRSAHALADGETARPGTRSPVSARPSGTLDLEAVAALTSPEQALAAAPDDAPAAVLDQPVALSRPEERPAAGRQTGDETTPVPDLTGEHGKPQQPAPSAAAPMPDPEQAAERLAPAERVAPEKEQAARPDQKPLAPGLLSPSPPRAEPDVRVHAEPRMQAAPAHLADLSLLDQIQASALKARPHSRVTVQLRPPELGSIEIAIESVGGRVSAHFHAAHPFVRTWLEANAPALRSQLAEAGVQLSDMTLSTSAHHQQWRGAGDQPAPRDLPVPIGTEASATHRSSEPPSAVTDRLVDCFA